MNIFPLDMDPCAAARMQCDTHITKMSLEAAQILCTAAFKCGVQGAPYEPTHMNRPHAKWACECVDNWRWLVEHANELHAEYMRRYKHGNRCFIAIKWASRLDPSAMMGTGPLTVFPAEVYPKPDMVWMTPEQAVDGYRDYYCRKEVVWIARSRAHALAYTAFGMEPKHGHLPLMVWKAPGRRPAWMPATVPSWHPHPDQTMLARAFAERESAPNPKYLIDCGFDRLLQIADTFDGRAMDR